MYSEFQILARKDNDLVAPAEGEDRTGIFALASWVGDYSNAEDVLVVELQFSEGEANTPAVRSIIHLIKGTIERCRSMFELNNPGWTLITHAK